MARNDDVLFDEQDLDNARFRCEHGTFIGNDFGADYLCFHCETGVTPEQFALALFWAHQEVRLERRGVWDTVRRVIREHGRYDARLATDVVRLVLDMDRHVWGDTADRYAG